MPAAPVKETKVKNGSQGFLNGKTGAQPFFPPAVIQPKLTVGPVNDPYETEADATAERVMRMPSAKHDFSEAGVNSSYFFSPKPKVSASLQRQCTTCEDEELQRKEKHHGEIDSMMGIKGNDGGFHASSGLIQRKCAECEREGLLQRKEIDDDEMVQMKPGNSNVLQRKCSAYEGEEELQMKSSPGIIVQRKGEECEWKEEKPFPQQTLKITTPRTQKKSADNIRSVPADVSRSIELSKGRGSSMDNATLTFMSSRFNRNFSDVKIHHNTDATSMSRQLGAKAFTIGKDIYFNDGEYQPGSYDGKKLLAHELTHVVQQSNPTDSAGQVYRKAEDEETVVAPVKGSVCDQYVPVAGAQVPVTSEAEGGELPGTPAPVPKEVSPSSATAVIVGKSGSSKTTVPEPKNTKKMMPDDPAFKELIDDSKKHSKKQKKHADPPEVKTAEAVDAVKVEKDEKAVASGATVATVDDAVETNKNQQQKFDPEEFKKDLKEKIEKAFLNTETDALPKNSSEATAIARDKSKLDTVTDSTKAKMKETKNNAVGSAKDISDTSLASEEYKKKIPVAPGKDFNPEKAGARPVIDDPARAVPKPMSDEDMQMDKEHDADSLDKTMSEHNVSDNQLAESEEPKFLDTLDEKQSSQRQLCKIPQKLREAEGLQLQGDAASAQKLIKGEMGGMNHARKDQFGQVEGKQGEVKSEGEMRLQEYYTDIKNIYETTELNVRNTLEYMECSVTTMFQKAVDDAFEAFKKEVTPKLEYYYDWHVIRRDYEKEDKMTKLLVNDQIDSQIKDLTKEHDALPENDPGRKPLEDRIQTLRKGRAKLIIEKIFDDAKKNFTDTLDSTLDRIAVIVTDGLNHAKDLIRQGREAVDREFGLLSKENQNKATEATQDFKLRFEDLEAKVNEKESDLKESLVKQYTESVAKLKDTFETIRKEAALSWWERAWRKIKEIVMIIIDIGKLLFKIVVKAAGVIGDIISHPIRFFGNLIDAVSSGFKNFIKNIGKHLEDIIFKLILGVVPAGLALPEKWDAKGIFSFVLGFFGLSKENIRTQAVIKFGEPVVAQLEKAFDLFVIFKNEGFAGLWEHIKEKIGDLKNAIIEEVKTFFKEAIIKAAIEFLLSALTPASGFIKVCKAIIGIVTFFIKNLVNILKLLDSILDSFADMVAGRITGAAKRVESALADILLIGIKFLAALVGINLDKIQSRISRILNAVRNPVNRAIQWFLGKAQAFAEKTGLLNIIRKANKKIEGGKEWVNDKVEKAKQGVLDLKDKLVNWALSKISFKDENGKSHKLYVKEVNGEPQMTVESTPKSVGDFLDYYEGELGTKIPKNKKEIIDNARSLLNGDIKNKMKEIKNTTKGSAVEKKLMQELLALEVQLSGYLKQLLGDTRDLAGVIERYELEGLRGTYESMPKPRGDELTADHQPQAAILEYAATLSPFKEKGINKLKNRAANRAHEGYAINLHKNRHEAGRTYGSKGKGTKNDFVTEADKIVADGTKPETKRKKIVALMEKDLNTDVSTMKKIAQKPAKDPVWQDIHKEKLGDKEEAGLIKDIRERIVSGEEIMLNQPMEELVE